MEFTELIEVRRSVRRYAKSEIAKNEMEKIVADALNAPSWKNSETTRYYAAIGEEAKNRLWKEALPGFNAANSADSAALVAVTFVPGESGFMGSDPADELGNMWGAYDCGLASSYFILAAKNRGWDTLGHRHWQGRRQAHQGSPQARRRGPEDGLKVWTNNGAP